MIGNYINNNKKAESFADLPKRNRTFDDFLNGITWVTVSFLILFVTMMYMTKITGVGSIDITAVTYEGIILYIITIGVSALTNGYVKRKDRNGEVWQKAYAEVETNNNIIIEKGYANAISTFCRAWEDDELDTARSHILADAGISLADFKSKYIKYGKNELRKAFPDLSDCEYKTIVHAKKIKRLKFDENYLSVYNKSGRRHSPSQGMTVSAYRRLNFAKRIVTTAITSILGVTLSVELIADPSFATVVMCIFKVMTIVIPAIIGMFVEHTTTTVKEVEEMGKKSQWQNRFIKYCEQNNAPTGVKIGGTLGVQENV